jgi:uncharacterized protein YkwD
MPRHRLLSLGLLLCTASCGADLGTSPSPEPGLNGSVPDVNLATEVSATSCPNLGTWSAQAVQFEAEVLRLVNQARSRGARCGDKTYAPTSALVANVTLSCVARRYAKTMNDGDFFDHTGLDGTSPFDRMRAAGLSFRGAAENIAVGQEDPDAVMQAWLDSPGHCNNLMGSYGEIGVGFYQGYWVQNFMLAR